MSIPIQRIMHAIVRRLIALGLVLPLALTSTPVFALRAGLEGTTQSEVARTIGAPVAAPNRAAAGMEEDAEATVAALVNTLFPGRQFELGRLMGRGDAESRHGSYILRVELTGDPESADRGMGSREKLVKISFGRTDDPNAEIPSEVNAAIQRYQFHVASLAKPLTESADLSADLNDERWLSVSFWVDPQEWVHQVLKVETAGMEEGKAGRVAAQLQRAQVARVTAIEMIERRLAKVPIEARHAIVVSERFLSARGDLRGYVKLLQEVPALKEFVVILPELDTEQWSQSTRPWKGESNRHPFLISLAPILRDERPVVLYARTSDPDAKALQQWFRSYRSPAQCDFVGNDILNTKTNQLVRDLLVTLGVPTSGLEEMTHEIQTVVELGQAA